MQRVLAERVIGINELKQNVDAVMRESLEGPIAVVENNQIKAYLVSADLYDAMLERLEVFDLVTLIHTRSREIAIPVSLDDL
ncbi:type II toxin-antitoxin system prevent-host-death family antitoxin [Pseudomonas sp. LB3P81]